MNVGSNSNSTAEGSGDDDNDDEEGQLASQSELRDLLEATLPQEQIVYAFGYGSGVLSQQEQRQGDGDDDASVEEKKVVDTIVVVNDAHKFHRANSQLNPRHYNFASSPSKLDAAAGRAAWCQRHDPVCFSSLFRNPKVYFVVTDDGLKYGVVQLQDLLEDLTDWRYLYLAGRMHKPTLEIINRQLTGSEEDGSSTATASPAFLVDDSSNIRLQQETRNLPAALSTSLLLQSLEDGGICSAPPLEVYAQIASLSYTGDFRMAAGAEDPDKIAKLVQGPGQLRRFGALYEAAVDRLRRDGVLSVEHQHHNGDSSAPVVWSWDAASPAARKRLWSDLPRPLQRLNGDSTNNGNNPKDSIRALQAALVSIVAPAARYQSLKGLATAGFLKSAAYAARKLSKGLFRSRR